MDILVLVDSVAHFIEHSTDVQKSCCRRSGSSFESDLPAETNSLNSHTEMNITTFVNSCIHNRNNVFKEK